MEIFIHIRCNNSIQRKTHLRRGTVRSFLHLSVLSAGLLPLLSTSFGGALER